jgi:hypothetical protein
MSTPREIFEAMPSRFVPGKAPRSLVYYFSVGDDRWVLRIDGTTCTATPGKVDQADCVVKAHPDVFVNLVLRGKAPGALDIARGRFKTNDPSLLLTLKDCFRV